MPARLEASFFVAEPPEIELRDGLFHIVQTVGEYRFERVMQPSTFAKTVWRGEQALASFRSGGNVVKFGRKVATDEAANGH